MRRIILVMLSVVAITLATPAGAAVADGVTGPDAVYFMKTGQYLSGEFLGFWHENGGVQTFGYPVSPEIEQDGLTVQYFERHVLELHPDNPEAHRVQLRRLGAEARDLRQLANTDPFQPVSDSGAGRFFSKTAQTMINEFLKYWEQNGGLRVFGYPLSSEFERDGMSVQYTERAIFESHPENTDEWGVLFERLGAQAANRDGVKTARQRYDGETPVYHEDLWKEAEPTAKPNRLNIDQIGVDAYVEHVGYTDAGAMQAPHGWNNVAWFEPGTVPGATGNAVVAGHYDAPGGVAAIFWDLNRLSVGDQITVDTDDGGELVFEVTEVEQFHVDDAPINKIFGKTDERNLNLITCTGVWDRSLDMYDQRLVVYTTLVE